MPSEKDISPVYSFLKTPTPQDAKQLISLYQAESWWYEDGENRNHRFLLEGIVGGSFLFMTVHLMDRIVGMGRVISDGISDAYIQDVTVAKQYRGQGIGSEIVKRLVEELKRRKIDWIGLIAERCSHGFYEHLDFKVMPNAEPMIYKN